MNSLWVVELYSEIKGQKDFRGEDRQGNTLITCTRFQYKPHLSGSLLRGTHKRKLFSKLKTKSI
jgi:hypothetical protein